MKRNYIPGTTTRFFGIVLLLICIVGLSHFTQLAQRNSDTYRLQQQYTAFQLQHLHALHRELAYDRNQLMDARLKSTAFVDHNNITAVQTARGVRAHFLSRYKDSLIAFACVLESVGAGPFDCPGFSTAVRLMDDDARLRRVDYRYEELYRQQTALYTRQLQSQQWATLRNEQGRQRIFYGFLLLQIWGIWMITYGEMLSRTPRG